jgi:hypothetical protein
MKTPLLLILALFLGFSLSAQKAMNIPANQANLKLHATLKPTLLEPLQQNMLFKPGAGPKTANVNETQIGQSTYDLQSNSGLQNRMYVYPDGTIGAVWTQGYNTAASYSDRGTGYNYFDGTSWGEVPTARIASETAKNGWPSYAPLGDGEMIISHTSASKLNFTTRPVKGTGAWTTVGIPGTTSYAWPRAITSGNTIHMIVNSGALYQGMTNALFYMRSTDKGVTWSTPAILPGLDATSLSLTTGFTGFGGDEYAWAAPKGDTIAFAVGNMLGGIFLMKSFDAGTTWTKTTVYRFPNFTGITSPVATTFDEIFSIALDNQGKVHLVTTRYKLLEYNSTAGAVAWSYYPTTDGIVYWNESMPQIDTAIYSHPDSLINRGMWIGGMQDYSGNDTIDFPDAGSGNQPWGDYRYVGPSSFTQINIDKDNNIFVSYSSLRENLINTGANPTVQLYRHLYVTSKLKNQTEWSEPIDLNDDLMHEYDEVVWAYMTQSNDGNLHFLCQIDSEPGTSIGTDLDPAGDNYIYYITFPTFVSVKPVDVVKNVSVSPNPAADFANVQLTLTESRKVELKVYDVLGKLVINNNYGVLSSGAQTLNVSTSQLPAGIYLFNVQVGNSKTTKKVIVN